MNDTKLFDSFITSSVVVGAAEKAKCKDELLACKDRDECYIVLHKIFSSLGTISENLPLIESCLERIIKTGDVFLWGDIYRLLSKAKPEQLTIGLLRQCKLAFQAQKLEFERAFAEFSQKNSIN